MVISSLATRWPSRPAVTAPDSTASASQGWPMASCASMPARSGAITTVCSPPRAATAWRLACRWSCSLVELGRQRRQRPVEVGQAADAGQRSRPARSGRPGRPRRDQHRRRPRRAGCCASDWPPPSVLQLHLVWCSSVIITRVDRRPRITGHAVGMQLGHAVGLHSAARQRRARRAKALLALVVPPGRAQPAGVAGRSRPWPAHSLPPVRCTRAGCVHWPPWPAPRQSPSSRRR